MAGLLGSLFSRIDATKRGLLDFAQNPVASVQQMVGYANDRARGLNELTSAAAQEAKQGLLSGTSGYGQANQQLAQTIADAYNPMGMTVWHGSPHKFSKFDASKIGTGEGNQAFGHGLYLAESPDVAKSYQNLRPISDPTDSGFINARAAFDIAKGKPKAALKWLDERISKVQQNAGFLMDKGVGETNALNRAKELISGGAFEPGQLYKVDLPDEHIANMLDWDKPLGQQSQYVTQAIQKTKSMLPQNAMDDLGGDLSLMYGPNVTPSQFLNTWEDLGMRAGGESALQKLGVPGVRYLDGGSRGAGGGTSNFVVFPGNEHLLQILERNGMAP